MMNLIILLPSSSNGGLEVFGLRGLTLPEPPPNKGLSLWSIIGLREENPGGPMGDGEPRPMGLEMRCPIGLGVLFPPVVGVLSEDENELE